MELWKAEAHDGLQFRIIQAVRIGSSPWKCRQRSFLDPKAFRNLMKIISLHEIGVNLHRCATNEEDGRVRDRVPMCPRGRRPNPGDNNDGTACKFGISDIVSTHDRLRLNANLELDYGRRMVNGPSNNCMRSFHTLLRMQARDVTRVPTLPSP